MLRSSQSVVHTEEKVAEYTSLRATAIDGEGVREGVVDFHLHSSASQDRPLRSSMGIQCVSQNLVKHI